MKKKICLLAIAALLLMLLTGCGSVKEEKLRDLDCVILSEEVLPKDLREIIDGKKEAPFRFTYSDRGKLYICIGYGKQETGGYSIVLDELYQTESAVYIRTTLLGPTPEQQAKKTAAYPYIVVETKEVGQPVIFE